MNHKPVREWVCAACQGIGSGVPAETFPHCGRQGWAFKVDPSDTRPTIKLIIEDGRLMHEVAIRTCPA